MLISRDSAGVVLKHKNKTAVHQDVNYASVTAPELVYIEVKIGGEVFDGVWVAPGSSHSLGSGSSRGPEHLWDRRAKPS